MKIKQIRRLIANLFPEEFAPVFERCYNAREIEVVTEALKLALAHAVKREQEYFLHTAKVQAKVSFLEAKVTTIEEEVAARRVPVIETMRDPQEEVLLVPPPLGPATAGEPVRDLRNKIGLIKAVREVSNMGLKEAKDLVEDVLDRGAKKSVFKGSLEKAAVAVRVLAAAGGTTERKETL
jgi:hypothetical protein